MQDNERDNKPSASSWRRRELCAGSYQLERKAKELGQVAHERSVDAERGTRVHAWLATEKIELTESELASAQFLKERGEEQVIRIFQGPAPFTMREKRLWLEVNGERVLSGRLDVVHYNATIALVQDYKTGFSEPDPADQNAQLRVLAVLVALQIPSLEEVIVQIISGPYGVTEARFTMTQLAGIYEEIVTTLQALSVPEAPLSPSPEACRFCTATLICPALRKTLKPVETVDLYQLPDGAAASELLGKVELFQDLLDEIKAYYKKRLSDDPTYQIPSWSLAPGAAVREVTDWELALGRLSEHLDAKALAGAAAYRLGDLERALAKTKMIRQKDAKEMLNVLLNGLIKVKENQPSLKRTGPKLVVKPLIES